MEMNCRGLFITGTDTGVGKTRVTSILASILKERVGRVGVMKPAESGCAEQEGRLLPEDAVRLKAAAGCELPLEMICPYSLSRPLAPAEAARVAGITIDIERIKQNFLDIRHSSDVILVEGAGGLMVPLSGNYLYADLIKELKLPLLIVARAGLGTVNHSLLTIEVARSKGIPVIAVLLNNGSPLSDASIESNPRILQDLSLVPVLGPLPYAPAGFTAHSIDEITRRVAEQVIRLAFPAE